MFSYVDSAIGSSVRSTVGGSRPVSCTKRRAEPTPMMRIMEMRRFARARITQRLVRRTLSDDTVQQVQRHHPLSFHLPQRAINHLPSSVNSRTQSSSKSSCSPMRSPHAHWSNGASAAMRYSHAISSLDKSRSASREDAETTIEYPSGKQLTR